MQSMNSHTWLYVTSLSLSSYNIFVIGLFITNLQLFSSQDVNWWTGVVRITCGLLWFFLSDVWTLCLTAPIHCSGSIAEQVNLFRINKLIHILYGLRMSTLSANVLFLGFTIPLIKLVNIAGNVHSSRQGFTDLNHFENNQADTVKIWICHTLHD